MLKLTVVIPVFNEQDYIRQCLESLIHQDDPADEIIIVNNNCTDRTIAIAREYDVIIIEEPKQGLIAARNKGFDAASYDILARCDADTQLPPAWTSRIKHVFRRRHIEAVSGPCYFYDAPFLNYNSTWNHIICFRVTKLITGCNALFGSNMAIRKRTWEEIRQDLCLDDASVHEDLDIAFHIRRYTSIRYERTLTAGISVRRMLHNPASFFIEYPFRWARMLIRHRHLLRR